MKVDEGENIWLSFCVPIYNFDIFTFLDLSTFIFYCPLITANVLNFKGNCTLAGDTHLKKHLKRMLLSQYAPKFREKY